MHYAFFDTSTNLFPPPRANGTCIHYLIFFTSYYKIRVSRSTTSCVGTFRGSLKIRIFLPVRLGSSDGFQVYNLVNLHQSNPRGDIRAVASTLTIILSLVCETAINPSDSSINLPRLTHLVCFKVDYFTLIRILYYFKRESVEMLNKHARKNSAQKEIYVSGSY